MQIKFLFQVAEVPGATGEATLQGKRGADLSRLFDRISPKNSYADFFKLIGFPAEYHVSKLEVRLIDGGKIIKKKLLTNSDEEGKND